MVILDAQSRNAITTSWKHACAQHKDPRKPIMTLKRGHTNEINSVCFSPDGAGIASGSSDRMIGIWDVKTGGFFCSPLTSYAEWVRSVCFSLDGTWIVLGSRDYTVRLWDSKTGKQIGAPWEGHTGTVRSVCFSPDGAKVASGSWDRTIRIWDAKTGPLSCNDQVYSVYFSPDGANGAGIVSASSRCPSCELYRYERLVVAEPFPWLSHVHLYAPTVFLSYFTYSPNIFCSYCIRVVNQSRRQSH